MSETKYIAIVDDHAMFRKGLASLINLFPGYKVLFDAANGQELIKQLQPRHLPDILLLDIVMPEMDGYATANWVRVNYPEIRILALSTMDAETAIIKMIKNGAKGYVLKDAEPTELKQAFDDVLTLGYYYNDLISRKVLQSVHQLTEENNNTTIFARLNEKELTFLKLACSEKTYLEIAGEMFLSERTIDGYRDALFKKLNVKTRVGLVMYAIKNGLVKI
ncbi:MAG TPA: response regulator transcription factor [Chitinophagaceae bacterium]|nr:response regulator transcription factor [Chitinophagaceae bacterium]